VGLEEMPEASAFNKLAVLAGAASVVFAMCYLSQRQRGPEVQLRTPGNWTPLTDRSPEPDSELDDHHSVSVSAESDGSAAETVRILDEVLAEVNRVKEQNRSMIEELRNESRVSFWNILQRIEAVEIAEQTLARAERHRDHPRVAERRQRLEEPDHSPAAREVDAEAIHDLHQSMVEWIREAVGCLRTLTQEQSLRESSGHRMRLDAARVRGAISEFMRVMAEMHHGLTEEDLNAGLRRHGEELARSESFAQLCKEVHASFAEALQLVEPGPPTPA